MPFLGVDIKPGDGADHRVSPARNEIFNCAWSMKNLMKPVSDACRCDKLMALWLLCGSGEELIPCCRLARVGSVNFFSVFIEKLMKS